MEMRACIVSKRRKKRRCRSGSGEQQSMHAEQQQQQHRTWGRMPLIHQEEWLGFWVPARGRTRQTTPPPSIRVPRPLLHEHDDHLGRAAGGRHLLLLQYVRYGTYATGRSTQSSLGSRPAHCRLCTGRVGLQFFKQCRITCAHQPHLLSFDLSYS
jgi:hypothetical protein